jgi:hypothetical protein
VPLIKLGVNKGNPEVKFELFFSDRISFLNLKKMKQFYFLLSRILLRSVIFCLFLFVALSSNAQCSGGSLGGALSPVPGSSYQTMNVTTGNYYTFVVAAGCLPTYDFSFCSADGSNATFDSQITILDNTGASAGGYSDDFCGLQSHVTWTPTVAGTYRVLVNTYSCGTGNTATLAYKTTTPPSMTFVSCTTVQSSTAAVTKCDLDQDVICVQVVTSGTCSALTLTQFQLGAGGSSSATLADVSLIHIYYTGTTNSFSASSEFVSGGTVPAGGSNTINGSQTLSAGTNYFWIAYDVNPAATTGNVIDASCTQITVGSARTPTATNPAGTRTIGVCSSYPGTNALGLKQWLKSDAGVSGTPVSTWTDQIGVTIANFVGNGTSRPTVVSTAVNFQDYIRFDGVNDTMKSNTNFTGNTLFGTTDNTILMIKNYKGGTVDYKWETDPTNAYRIGMETNGTAQRIDFVDDNGGGKNNASTTSIFNKDVMVEYLSDATTINLKLNGNVDATKTHPSLTFSPGGVISHPLFLGGNGFTNSTLFCQVDMAEVMTFNKKLSASELRRVESYLALKYGITLGNNKGGGSSVIYMASDGTQIWNNHTGYHNYVIGIGRDNAAGSSGLNKLKSTSVVSLNGSTDIITLANSNFTTPAAFGNDKAFLIAGNNAGSLATPIYAFYSHAGPATTIAYQSSRIWATQKTGTHSGNLIIEVDMALVNGPTGYGTNTNTDIRLLLDDDVNFSNASAGEHTYSPAGGFAATGGKIYFSVPYADIQAGTGYFTIGSVNGVTAPLPVTLTEFKAECHQEQTELKWSTASETNNDHFTIDLTNDGINYQTVATIAGAGTSSMQHLYSWTDDREFAAERYYRLSQTDYDGTLHLFNTIRSDCGSMPGSLEITNVTSSGNELLFEYNSMSEGNHLIKLYDGTGKLVFSGMKFCGAGPQAGSIEISEFGAGIYLLVIREKNNEAVKKVMIVK